MRSAVLVALLVLVLFFAGGCALIGSSPPQVPHNTGEPFSDCKSCHATGAQGAPVTDHIKKENCLTCHKPGTQEQGGP